MGMGGRRYWLGQSGGDGFFFLFLGFMRRALSSFSPRTHRSKKRSFNPFKEELPAIVNASVPFLEKHGMLQW